MSNKNIYDSDYVKPHQKSSPLQSARSEIVDDDYDYSNSTTHNYSWKGPELPSFVGKYAGIRQLMDYSYHKHYNPKRQYLHDKLIDESLCGVDFNTGCEKLEENWLVFTAGTMVSRKITFRSSVNELFIYKCASTFRELEKAMFYNG